METIEEKWNCDACEKTFENELSLKQHIRQNHEVNHVCNFRNIACIQTNILKQHIQSVHQKNQNDPCEFCRNTFMISCLLAKNRENITTHKDPNDITIVQENYTFKSEDDKNVDVKYESTNPGGSNPNDFTFDSENHEIKPDDTKDEIKDEEDSTTPNLQNDIFQTGNDISEKTHKTKSHDAIKEHQDDVISWDSGHEENGNFDDYVKQINEIDIITTDDVHDAANLRENYDHDQCYGSEENRTALNNGAISESVLSNGNSRSKSRKAKFQGSYNEENADSTENVPDLDNKVSQNIEEMNTIVSQMEENYAAEPINLEQEKVVTKQVYPSNKTSYQEFTCNECDKVFPLKRNLTCHIKAVHEKIKDKKCKLCDATFNKLFDFQSHMKKIHQTFYKCEFCCEVFTKIQLKDRHTEKDHMDKIIINKILESVIGYVVSEERRNFVKCNECDMFFVSQTNVLKHKKRMHEQIVTHCEICDETFQEKEFNEHVEKLHKTNNIIEKDGQKWFLCKYCLKTVLLKHKTLHFDKKHYDIEAICQICEKRFQNKFQARAHMQRFHAEVTCKCEACGKTFLLQCDKFTHIRKEHWTFQCKHCNKNFESNAALIKHKDQYHSELKETYEIKCIICDIEFSSHLRLRKHIKTIHEQEKKIHCKECSVGYDDMQKYQSHVKSYHSDMIPSKDKQFQCKQCKESFSQDNHLQVHMARNHPKHAKKHVCHMCQKEFLYKIEVTKHIEKDHDGWYDCLKCDKKYRSRHILDCHLKKVHEGVVGMKCDHCEFTSVNNFLLDVHIKKNHTEKRQFACTDCTRVFNRKYNLTSHIKSVHNKIKDKKCEFCGVTFSRADNLNNHVDRVHKDKTDTYVCEQCGKTLSRKDLLKEHINIVHEKKFKLCEFCGKSFIRQIKLSRHLKGVHKVKVDDRDLHMDIYENGEKSKLCDYCGKDFEKPHQLRKHLSKIHNIKDFYENEHLLSKDKKVTNPADQIILPILNVTLYNVIQRSSKSVNPKLWSHRCKFCLKVYHDQKNYYRHIKDRHPDKYRCEICDKSFSSSKPLAVHKKLHYRCDICEVYLVSELHMKSHVRDHHTTTTNDVSKKNIYGKREMPVKQETSKIKKERLN